jgi:multiple sugar transport system permease protein
MSKNSSKAIIHLLLIIGACVMILPLLWMVLTSLKSVTESTSMHPFVYFPSKFRIENYIAICKDYNFFHLYFNTISMIILRIICSVTFSAMAAYAFARLEFPGRDFLFGIVLIQMMVPVQIFIIPQYLMVDAMHMRNTIFALLFPGLVSAFGTFLLKQFFMGLPKELEEASILDGCNIGQTFVKVMLPLSKSALWALSIFTALFAFKDLMWPMIVNTDTNASTLSSALAIIQSSEAINYPQFMAACTIAICPMLLIYIIFQKQIIQGIATTGSKL